MVYYYDILNAQRGRVKPVRPRRPQASRRVSRFVAPATPRSTRDPSVAQASDDGLEVVGGSPKTAAGDRYPPRVVVLPPFLHVTALALQDPSASMSNMKSMATRLRTSKPRLPPVAGVPVVSSVQCFNVAITSTDTRPADGSAIARPRVDAMARPGKGVNDTRVDAAGYHLRVQRVYAHFRL